MGSSNKYSCLFPQGSLPGQKSIRLAKKGKGSSLPDAGFRRFSPAIPLSPHLFAETKRRELGKDSPGPFWLQRLLSCPGNKEMGMNDQRIWR
jgi:hypothetical protein